MALWTCGVDGTLLGGTQLNGIVVCHETGAIPSMVRVFDYPVSIIPLAGFQKLVDSGVECNWGSPSIIYPKNNKERKQKKIRGLFSRIGRPNKY